MIPQKNVCSREWCIALPVEGHTQCVLHLAHPLLRPLTLPQAIARAIDRLDEIENERMTNDARDILEGLLPCP